MRRPTRTRRLSIAATVSLLLFVVVAILSVRSFWIVDELHFKHLHLIQTDSGSIAYYHWHGRATAPAEVGFWWHNTNQKTLWRTYGAPSPWDFHVQDFQTFPEQPGLWAMFTIELPLWFPLLLLLIAPVRWLIARRASAPAFPVIANAKQG